MLMPHVQKKRWIQYGDQMRKSKVEVSVFFYDTEKCALLLDRLALPGKRTATVHLLAKPCGPSGLLASAVYTQKAFKYSRHSSSYNFGWGASVTMTSGCICSKACQVRPRSFEHNFQWSGHAQTIKPSKSSAAATMACTS